MESNSFSGMQISRAWIDEWVTGNGGVIAQRVVIAVREDVAGDLLMQKIEQELPETNVVLLGTASHNGKNHQVVELMEILQSCGQLARDNIPKPERRFHVLRRLGQVGPRTGKGERKRNRKDRWR